jgi:hypothetical protein
VQYVPEPEEVKPKPVGHVLVMEDVPKSEPEEVKPKPVPVPVTEDVPGAVELVVAMQVVIAREISHE